MSNSEYLKAVEQLFYWQCSRTNSFSDMLFDLFQKADADNRFRLSIAFPNHAAALDDWNEAGDYGNDLFRKHGFLGVKGVVK